MKRFILSSVTAALFVSPAFSQSWITSKLVLEDEVMTDSTLAGSMRDITINNATDWLVMLSTDHADNDYDRILVGPGGIVQGEEQALADPVGGILDNFYGMELDNAGNLAQHLDLTGAGVSSSDDGALTYNLKIVAREGSPCSAPQFSVGTVYAGIDALNLADNGTILLNAEINDPLLSASDLETLILIKVDPAGNLISETALFTVGDAFNGGTVLSVYADDNSTDVNAAGQYICSLEVDYGVAGVQDTVVVNGVAVATEGSPSPLAGRNWTDIGDVQVAINASGSWTFSGEVDGDSATNLVIIKDGAVYRQTGDTVPGVPGFLLTGFGKANLDLANNGAMAWFGEWNDTNSATDTGLFVDDQVIAQEGVTTFGGVLYTNFSHNSDNQFFLADNGKTIVYEAFLIDGTGGVYMSTYAYGGTTVIPGCNPSGGLMLAASGTPSVGTSMSLSFNNAQSSPAGVYFAISPFAGTDAMGCGVTLPVYGEVLIGLSPIPELLPIGIYNGAPVVFNLSIPNDPAYIGITVFGQGMFVDPGSLTEQIRLTNGLRFDIGL